MFYKSYMAKIVFNRERVITRIIANIGELRAYKWECPNFEGF